MRVTLLGTGCPPPNPRRRGPATLLVVDTHRYLVDVGSGVAGQLSQVGVGIADLDRVFLTHLHSDHVVDLGHLVLTRWILGQNAALEVYGPAGTRAHVERLLALWEWDIEVRRAHMREREPPRVVVTEIGEGEIFRNALVKVSAFAVEHEPVTPAFGFLFEGGDRRVALSGDTRPSENLIRWARGVDLLIHECTEVTKTRWVPGCGWPSHEAKVKALASYHTQPDEVGEVATRAGARSLVLTHMMPGSEPADLRARAARQFPGPVVVGEDLQEV